MGGLSALGQGLLAGFGGAMQGAEGYIQTECEQKNKRSLEEYRAEKLMELETYKQKFETHRDDIKASQKAGSDALLFQTNADDRDAQDERARLDRAGRVEVAKIGAGSGAAVAKGEALAKAQTASAVNQIVSAVGPKLNARMDSLDPDATPEVKIDALISAAKGNNDTAMVARLTQLKEAITSIPSRSALLAADNTRGSEPYTELVFEIFRPFQDLLGDLEEGKQQGYLDKSRGGADPSFQNDFRKKYGLTPIGQQ